MSAPDQDKPVRYFMGMKKEGGVPIAPWGGSTFEENCKDAKKCTEYDDVFLPVGVSLSSIFRQKNLKLV